MTQYSIVDHVEEIASELRQATFIGLDTEFMREKTFFAELCLVQVATTTGIYCVDPLGNADMQQFWDAAMPSGWVVHSARQDIEVIYQSAGRMPLRLFDTQVAAGLLGHAPQLGYANLVSALFGVELPKSHTRADWSRRPLADAELQYAAEDVQYLLPARDLLAEQLDRRGRRRVAAAELAAWREAEALRVNSPRQWIARDSALLEIANRLPQTTAELNGIDGLPGGLVRRSGGQILELVAASQGDGDGYRPPTAPDEAQKALLKKLQQVVAECATDLGLAAETVASRKELSAVIIDGSRDSRVFSGWRNRIVGERLLQLL